MAKYQRRNRTPDPTISQVWDDTGPTNPLLQKYIDASLHCNYRPHPGQFEFIKSILPPPRGRGIKRAFVKCGRKWGKSRSGSYIAHRFAVTYPNKRVYILAPEQKQAAEIYWHSGDITDFMTYKGEANQLISHTDHQGFRQSFINGSFIKVDGSDNYNAQRGWNPDVIIADEFAEFHPNWAEVMIPNLVARNAILVIMGTPPREPLLPDGTKHSFVQFFEQYEAESLLDPPTAYVTTGTSFDNPNISKDALEGEIKRLELQGDYVTIRREYYGEIVYGGKRAIFPMFSEARHLEEHELLAAMVYSSPDRFEWYGLVDPGTTSVFAALFIAFDRYTATPYFLDCLYETKPQDCTVDSIMPKFLDKCAELSGVDIKQWNLACDSAAAWFIQEASDRYGIGFGATKKRAGDKLEGLSMLRDIFVTKERLVSKRCRPLVTEIVNYKTNDRGILQKEWDHLIDLMRYFLGLAGYSLNESKYTAPVIKPARPTRPDRDFTFKEHPDDITIDSVLLEPEGDYVF